MLEITNYDKITEKVNFIAQKLMKNNFYDVQNF